MKKYTIDAQGKRLGRVASQVASLLRGKGEVTFERNRLSEVEVLVLNCAKLELPEKRISEARRPRYTGYPGGLKHSTRREFLTKRGYGELFRDTVLRMLPRNRLRSRIIKHLTVKG